MTARRSTNCDTLSAWVEDTVDLARGLMRLSLTVAYRSFPIRRRRGIDYGRRPTVSSRGHSTRMRGGRLLVRNVCGECWPSTTEGGMVPDLRAPAHRYPVIHALSYRERRAIRRLCYPAQYALWDALRLVIVLLVLACLIGTVVK